MKNQIVVLAIIFCLVLISVFALESWREQNRVYSLTMATGSKTGEYYHFGQAFAKVISKYNPNIKLNIIETPGSLANLNLLSQKKVDLAIVQNDVDLNSFNRAISPLFPEMFHLIARVDSGINKVTDLKNKRIGLMPKGSGSYDLFWPLIKHYGIDQNEVKAFPSSADIAYKKLIEGKLDAVFRIVAVGNNATVNLVQDTEKIQLVPIDQASALNLFFPSLEASEIPKGTYNGSIPIPSEDLPTVALRALLITNETLPRNVANIITTTLFDSGKEIAKIHPPSSLITKLTEIDSYPLLFHEGSQDFFNNTKPNFFVENADFIGLLMSIGALIASGIWQANLWLQQKQKNNADRYNAELLVLIKNIEEAQTPEEINEVRSRLFAIFNTVVNDLDKDKISDDSFQSFSFTWNVALSTIRHKEFLLNNLPITESNTTFGTIN